MGRDDDDDRSNKRRKIDFNPLRSDDRFGDLPTRSPSRGYKTSNGSNGAFGPRSSTPRAGSRLAGGSTPSRRDSDGPGAGDQDPGATKALDRDWYGGDDDL